MYTVVSCPKCKENAWIVQDTPDRSKCGKCGHNRQFKRLKKYHRTEDADEARLVLAEVKAKLNDMGDEFQDALENGVLTGDAETSLSDSLPDSIDVSAEELNEVDDRIMNQNRSLSHTDAVEAAIDELEPAEYSEIVSFCKEHGVPEEKVDSILNSMLMNGNIYEVEDSVYKRI